LTTTCVSGVTL